MNSNEKKNLKLGMSYGKATHILRKTILFDLVKKLNLDICYRCNKNIKTIKELSVEHKKAWLNAENSVELFFDLNNIAFSHLKCNVLSSNRKKDECSKLRASISQAGNNAIIPFLQIEEIRTKLNCGTGVREVAREYNISHAHVMNIRDFKRRKFK